MGRQNLRKDLYQRFTSNDRKIWIQIKSLFLQSDSKNSQSMWKWWIHIIICVRTLWWEFIRRIEHFGWKCGDIRKYI